MSTIYNSHPPVVLPVTRFDIPQEEPAYSLCDNVTTCLLGRVDLNLRNIALLAGIVASVAGTILTYLSGSLYFAAHFAVSAVVSIYSFFEMRDVELARELNGALGQVKTQYLTLRENTQAVATEAARLETTNEELSSTNEQLSTRNTEFQNRISELEETRAGLEETKDQLQTKLGSLQETRDQLQTNVDHLKDHLLIVDQGDKIYQENMRKISETTEQQQRARDELLQIQAQLNIVQNLLSKEVSKFQEQNDRLSSITNAQTQLFSPVRGSGSAEQGSGSPVRGSGTTDHL